LARRLVVSETIGNTSGKSLGFYTLSSLKSDGKGLVVMVFSMNGKVKSVYIFSESAMIMM